LQAVNLEGVTSVKSSSIRFNDIAKKEQDKYIQRAMSICE